MSVAMLVIVLAFAVARPRGLPEAVVAVPAAIVVVASGVLPWSHAAAELARLAPVAGFLAAVLVLARLCDDEGLFRAAGTLLARGGDRPVALLARVFVVAAVTTAILSLDATVVLLTPVVFATATRVGVRAKPHVYACTHLANTGSLLLPVSNLTNLLAFATVDVSFTRFAALMAAPWLVAVGVEFLVFRRFFAADLAVVARAEPSRDSQVRGVPAVVLAVLVLTLAGFAVTSLFGANPAWAALGGVVVLGTRALVARRSTIRSVVGSANVPFLAFVLALGVVVRAVVDNGLSGALGHVVPDGTGLAALLGIAAVAAILANVVNNLPAVLVLLPLAAPSGVAAVLAVLIGVNVGPNLTYVGSLATLLWRRVLHHHDTSVDLGEFTRLGLLTVPLSLVPAVLALWVGVLIGGGA